MIDWILSDVVIDWVLHIILYGFYAVAALTAGALITVPIIEKRSGYVCDSLMAMAATLFFAGTLIALAINGVSTEDIKYTAGMFSFFIIVAGSVSTL